MASQTDTLSFNESRKSRLGQVMFASRWLQLPI